MADNRIRLRLGASADTGAFGAMSNAMRGLAASAKHTTAQIGASFSNLGIETPNLTARPTLLGQRASCPLGEDESLLIFSASPRLRNLRV